VQERARRTRELILEAAAEEFSAHGYAQTALGVVAARTGMTKGALYGHFASKAELAAELVSRADLARLMAAGRLTPDCDPLLALRALTLGLCRVLDEDPLIRAALRLVDDEPAVQIPRWGLFVDVQRMMEGLIRQAQESGAVHRCHAPDAIARLVLLMVLGMRSAALPPAALDREREVDMAWELLVTALSTGRGGAD
jgi:AcrR family transcriptional regulator